MLVWVVATIGVTYVANAAVELVDLQVFPQGGRIEVLARAQPTPTTLPRMRATTTQPPAATTTVVAPVSTTTTQPPPTTQPPAATTTVVAPVSTTTTQPPAPLVMAASVLADGRTGVAYRTRLVIDDSAPFVWQVESGDLPAGLNLTAEGYLEGTPTGSGRYVFTVSSVGDSDRIGREEYSIVVREYRIVSARGGSVTVIVQGNSVVFFSALQTEGFDQAVLVRGGPIVVEVQFLPGGGDDTSWVRCEATDGVVCSHG